MTVGQVLQCLGYRLTDFKTHEEAMAFVEKHVSKNQAQNNSLERFPPCKDEDPLLNRYYYVHDQGKKRFMTGTESKKLEGSVSGKQLSDLHK